MSSDTPQWKPDSLERWVDNLDREKLDIIEHQGRGLYPDAIKRINPKSGAVESVPVLLRVPNTTEKAIARRDAINWAAQLLGKRMPGEATEENIVKVLGHNRWQHLDNICLLSRTVFDAKPQEDGTPRRHGLPEYLDATYPQSSLYDLESRLAWWSDQEDPRLTESQLTQEEVFKLAAAIAEKGHAGPLLAIDGRGLPAFIVFLARLLPDSPTPKSS